MTKVDPIFSLQYPWTSNENTTWLASTISLSRNIEKFKFPVKLEADRQRQIVDVVGRELVQHTHLSHPNLVLAENLPPLQKEFLIEHFLSQQSLQQAHTGEAVVVDDTGSFLALINIGEHIRFQLIDITGELETTWNKLISIESSLGKSVSYAYSQKYGFLTSDFTQCGTALNVAVFLQLPALIHKEAIDATLENHVDDSFIITGIQGNPTEMIGDVIVLQNNYTLGLTEEVIISNIRSLTTKLLVEENSAKSAILHQDNVEIKDRVSRAFGILIHSYQIEAVEALNAISLLKLGVELGWAKGISLKELNHLFFNCRRAHLFRHFGDSIKQELLPHKRSEFIHAALKNVQLTI